MVRWLESQSRGPMFKTIGWFQGQLSLSFIQGRSNKYQKIPRTYWSKVKCLLVIVRKLERLEPYTQKGAIKSLFFSSEFWVINHLTILKVVSATFLLVCFACLKERTCETRKMFFISLRKLFSFLR